MNEKEIVARVRELMREIKETESALRKLHMELGELSSRLKYHKIDPDRLEIHEIAPSGP